MTEREAIGWLEQVGARLLRHPGKEGSSWAWAAVICTPATGGRRGKIILGFGASLEAAAAEAEKRWERLWGDLGPVH